MLSNRFTYLGPKKGEIRSLVSKVKENIVSQQIPPYKKDKFESADFYERVEAKVADFDVKGAVKLLSSDDTFAPFNAETLSKLRSKHPLPSRQLSFPTPPSDEDEHLLVTPGNIKKAIKSFACGSASGPDGFRPQFFKDIISISAGKEGADALSAITDLSNFMLAGKVNDVVCKFLYGASLCALNKKDGGIRPIAIGLSIRRLVSKLACCHANEVIGEYFSGKQVGFGVKQGCEAAIHATRSYVSNPLNESKVCLKVDYRNAFNSSERDVMLNEVKMRTPLLFKYFWQSYSRPSVLSYNSNFISSSVGAQQGDPSGPFLFSLSIQPIIDELKSDLNVWYLDDGTVCDEPAVVLSDFMNLIRLSKDIGLEVNPSKCELYFCSGVIDDDVFREFQVVAPGITIISKENFNLLGSPIFEEGFENMASVYLDNMDIMFKRLTNLNAHVSFFLLKNCFAIPKLTSFIRSSPAWKFKDFVKDADSLIRTSLESILNVQLGDIQWIQASLPINSGGLGIRRLKDISLPAFLSSTFGSSGLVSLIIKTSDETNTSLINDALEQWKTVNASVPPVPEFQKNWDLLNVQRLISEEMLFSKTADIARFKALQCKESNSWLKAVPSPNIGTLLDDDSLRICIGLRLGSQLCSPHVCVCGTQVTRFGLHGLSCQKSAGRYCRHSEINKIIYAALSSIHVPASLEPEGLSRDDGKRPDGVTLIPWSKGRLLVWDSTCTDTFADSYIKRSAKVASSAAELAAHLKHGKHSYIKSLNYEFLAFAVETMGPFSKEALDFTNTIGSELIKITGDRRAKDYLFQRLSLAIQRANVACIKGTLPPTTKLNEVFYL